MNNLLVDMNMCIAIVYLDDVNVVGCTHVECWCNTMRILAALASSSMSVSARKCCFCIHHMVVLGHNLGTGVLTPNSKKLSKLKHFKPSQLITELK